MCLRVAEQNERIFSGLFHSEEEGERLRSIRDCERKQTDSHIFQCLREVQWMEEEP